LSGYSEFGKTAQKLVLAAGLNGRVDVAVAEDTIAKSRSGEYYEVLKAATAPGRLYLGFLPSASMLRQDAQTAEAGGSSPIDGTGIAGLLGSMTEAKTSTVTEGEEQTTSGQAAPTTLFYVVALSADQATAAVEFAVPVTESAATFLYRVDGDPDAFVNRLNRAMEAVDYKRDVISMPDDQLRLPENRRYAMAVRRSPALARIREAFVERLIHNSVDAWKKNLEKYFS